MPLSLHIAQGNKKRVAGRKGPVKDQSEFGVLRARICGLGLLLDHGAQ